MIRRRTSKKQTDNGDEAPWSGPQFSESQRIGEDAKRLFNSKRPSRWIAKDLDGGSDFGIDIEIQIAKELAGQRILYDLFFVQVKGTEHPEFTKDGKFIYARLSDTTCRYLLRQPAPVMIVQCDLSVDPEELTRCPVYYTWLKEDLLRRVDHRTSSRPSAGKGTLRIKIPKANLLTSKTDVTEFLNREQELRRAGKVIEAGIKEREPGLEPAERLNGVNRIVENLTQKTMPILSVLAEERTTAWPQAPAGSLAAFLERAKQALRYGRDSEAALSLEKSSSLLSEASEVEIGEYWYLIGQLRALQGRATEASAAYLKSTEAKIPVPRHLAAWAESEFHLRQVISDTSTFQDIIKKLGRSSAREILDIKARILASEGRFDKAKEVARRLRGPQKWLALAIVSLDQGDAAECLSSCGAGLEESSLPDGIHQNLLIIRARASYQLAAIGKKAPHEANDQNKFQNPELLSQAWLHALKAFESLQLAGWGVNTEAIADIVATLAIAMNREPEVLPQLQGACQVRPNFCILQRALEDVAASSGEFTVALKANARTKDSDGKILRRLIMLHDSRHFADCLEEFSLRAESTRRDHPLFPTALFLAIDSADKLHRKEKADKLLETLESLPNAGWQRALLKFIRATATNVLSKENSIEILEADYLELQKPPELAGVLFQNLDPANPRQAQRCYEVGLHLYNTRLVSVNDTTRLAQCLATLGRWDDLLHLMQEAMVTFGAEEHLLAIKAISLDKLGETPEALGILRGLVESSDFDSVAQSAYIEIVSRCGFVQEAVFALEQTLSNADTKCTRITVLRLLFQILFYENPTNRRCLEITVDLSQLVEPTIEREEGLYLMFFLAATTFLESPVEEDLANIFRTRSKEFLQRFPNSKILRAFQISEDDPLRDLERALGDFSGETQELRRGRQKLLNELDRGQLSLPFALRPGILPGRYDVASLWETCKRAGSRDKRFQLVMTTNEWNATPISAAAGKVLLLDFLTINIIHDLDIWDALFGLLPQIAISQSTMYEMLISGTPILGSAFATKCREIRERLMKYSHRILQPRPNLQAEDELNELPKPLADIVAIVRDFGDKYSIYSDDASIRLYCSHFGGPTANWCTLDILEALVNVKLISQKQAAEKIAQLTMWNVQVNIYLRYIPELAPDEIDSLTDIASAIESLEKKKYFYGLAREIWTHAKPLEALMKDSIGLFVMMATSNRSAMAIAAVMGSWHSKVRLHREAPQPIKLVSLLLANTAGQLSVNRSEEISSYAPDGTFAKLWSVFKLLIEFEFGYRMDEQKEQGSIELAGEVAAELDRDCNLQGSASVFDRLSRGLVKGTADWESFYRGYHRFWRRTSEDKVTSLKENSLPQLSSLTTSRSRSR